ncbi:MAG: radical SAM protein [Candidatus Aminicenantes bacterium]|nr:MAG: radical SAM protein [Candidatus Aminicenantes bacterium]
MQKLRIGVIDLVAHSVKPSLYGRVMAPNFAGIMPQVVAVWCEEMGHDVTYICFTRDKDLPKSLKTFDLVIMGVLTKSAQLAYSLSNLFRSQGAVTALGGPHARCYPQDAANHFDYVLGFTDKELVSEVLKDCSPHRPEGLIMSAKKHPSSLPNIRQRWKFIKAALDKAPFIKIIPIVGSLGCPYSCHFCYDSAVPFQSLNLEEMKEDFIFLLKKLKRPRLSFYDPNFSVQIDRYLDLIEENVPPGSIDFYAESSLSFLTESRLQRMKKNGFKVMVPGIESWYEMGEKSKTGKKSGMEKVRQVSEHINLIMSYIPYLQANFMFPFDSDEGAEPFELTKRFVDLSPGAFPAYSLLTAFGQAAPLNLEYQKQNRILPLPFYLLDCQQAMNVVPKNYSWTEFYNHYISLAQYTVTRQAMIKRYKVNTSPLWRWMNVFRGLHFFKVINFCKEFLSHFQTDENFKKFYLQESSKVPQYYLQWMRKSLGPFWEWLPGRYKSA